MLMPILKELFLWLYDMFLDLIGFGANSLLKVMSTDLTYFETNVPAIKTMYSVFVAVGWALLLGNMVFQAMKSMFSGLGFEGENPAVLLIRSGIFGFLLIFSRQICDIGMGISKKVIELLGIPTQINLKLPEENFFGGFDSGWMLVIIIGLLLGIQLVKLFLEIGERYVIVAILTLFAPVGFAMGGSKATKDIFTGYIRMYASMLLMMVMNVVFLKLILSAMSIMPSGVMVLPWGILVVGLAKAARKIDGMIGKIGLNPANTGDPLSRGGIGMATMMAARMAISSASRSSHRLHSSSQNSLSAAAGGNRSTPQKPYGASERMGQPYQPPENTGFEQPNTDRFGMNTESAHTNMQNPQNNRFGATSYVQGGATHAPQSTAVQSNANIGGSNGVNYNRFGTHTINSGASVQQQHTHTGAQASTGQQMVSNQAVQTHGGTSSNMKQNSKTQAPQPPVTRFGQDLKGKKPEKGNNRPLSAGSVKQAPTGGMKLTPNFRKPPMPHTVLKEQQTQQAESNPNEQEINPMNGAQSNE